MTNPIVRLPPLDELALNWPRIEPLLRRVTQITECYEPIDVLKLAMAGRVGIWVAGDIDAVIVAEVKVYPLRRVLEIVGCGGGNMSSWLQEAIRVMDEYARQCGCSHVAGIGRPGWERAWQARRTGGVVVVHDLKGDVDG